MKENNITRKKQKRVGEWMEPKLRALMEAHERKQAVTAKLTIGLDLGTGPVATVCWMKRER